MADIPPNGSIIRYAYLWKWQRDNHETEGRKERPVCLTLSLPHGDQTALIMLAISGTPPRYDQTARLDDVESSAGDFPKVIVTSADRISSSVFSTCKSG